MKILFYSPQTSSRLSYIIDFFSKQINAEIIITNDIGLYKSTDAIKINYSSISVAQYEFHVQPHTLLFEQHIQQQNVEFFEWHNLKAFFKTTGDLPFDIFAATFYLLSRYEEYFPHEKDMYGRFAHKNSLAFKEEFLQLPLINLWIVEFKKLLQKKFSNFQISEFSNFRFLPTYDIDIAYAYKNHSFFKNFIGFSKDFALLNFKGCLQRLSTVIGVRRDPFDTYEWLEELHKKYNLHPEYFFLLAVKKKGYDKNLSPYLDAMQDLIKAHDVKYNVGIHPSWQSGDDVNVLRKEISLLESITGKNVTKSRQHYIRMTLPQTYQLLIDNGIKEDYSMGYGSINGFRASVASSFYWYDLSKEQQTDLEIYPFCYMEANAYFEQKYTVAQAAEELQQYHDVVKSIGGTLITIFHNHFVTEQKEWLPWRNMYAEFLMKNFK